MLQPIEYLPVQIRADGGKVGEAPTALDNVFLLLPATIRHAATRTVAPAEGAASRVRLPLPVVRQCRNFCVLEMPNPLHGISFFRRLAHHAPAERFSEVGQPSELTTQLSFDAV